MWITEAQLRRVIRELALLENTADKDSSSQSHKQLEAMPVDKKTLMKKGDATYTGFIKKHPKAQAGIDAAFSEFEKAKTNRLIYLNQDFTRRYNDLEIKIQNKSDIDVEKIKDAMIDRVRQTELALGTYGLDIKKNGDDDLYHAVADPGSGWRENLSNAGYTSMSDPDGYHVIAYASRAEPLVVSEPPSLKLGATGEVESAILAKSFLATMEHEIIHQEDHAADDLLGKPEDASVPRLFAQTPSSAQLASNLVVKAMMPPAQITASFIADRLFSEYVSKSALAAAEISGFDMGEDVRLMTAITAVAMYAENLDPRASVSAYRIAYGSLPKKLRDAFENIKTDSPDFERASQILLQFTGDPKYKMADLFKGYLLDSHLRITLLLMLPHLQRALSESSDPNVVIDRTLEFMDRAQLGDDTDRAALILAVTDPKKLADLTMVAVRELRQGSKEAPTALTERITQRWAQLAGLHKD